METKRFYFTFGTDPDYPYGRNDYVLVEAQNLNQAIDIFTMIHPKRPGSDCVNCFFRTSKNIITVRPRSRRLP